eukprot:TRINITY_DN2886_c0_g2_i1.p1 TRINITY_DN2886_c0_g2~~TRINITY_DN2886_c0_g2_i1.p1  ORF type:complete len:262 (+),score=18.69 TRINITY_DN2886_c0_g2_i1:30-788(+)
MAEALGLPGEKLVRILARSGTKDTRKDLKDILPQLEKLHLTSTLGDTFYCIDTGLLNCVVKQYRLNRITKVVQTKTVSHHFLQIMSERYGLTLKGNPEILSQNKKLPIDFVVNGTLSCFVGYADDDQLKKYLRLCVDYVYTIVITEKTPPKILIVCDDPSNYQFHGWITTPIESFLHCTYNDLFPKILAEFKYCLRKRKLQVLKNANWQSKYRTLFVDAVTRNLYYIMVVASILAPKAFMDLYTFIGRLAAS